MPIKIKLSEVRAERGISFGALSERTGVTKANLIKLSQGKSTRLDLNTLDVLCRELDVAVSDLLEYVPD